MKIFYLGPPASFTHQAALTLFQPPPLEPANSIEDVLITVKNATPAVLGIVPVENSHEGMVIRTLDLILQNNLQVIAEINLKVKQNLLSKENTLKNIKEIYSHPQALAQVRNWLQKHLPQANLREVISTSKAAEIIQGKPNTAAIASQAAAKMYNLHILAQNIQDNKANLTRFWAVSKKNHQPSLKLPITQFPLKTKTAAYLIIKDKVGALRNLLDTFAANQISLTSIQSRPRPDKPWQYGFFVDLLVDANDPLANEMFKKLKKEHPVVKILGTYPQTGVYNRQGIINYHLKRIEQIFKDNSQTMAIKKEIDKINHLITRQISTPAHIKKILTVRSLVIPSIALYKHQHQQKIEDRQRERALLQKIKRYGNLESLYLKVLKRSKKLQKDIISLIQSQAVSTKNILRLDIKDLRYYIDYLDALAVNLSAPACAGN